MEAIVFVLGTMFAPLRSQFKLNSLRRLSKARLEDFRIRRFEGNKHWSAVTCCTQLLMQTYLGAHCPSGPWECHLLKLMLFMHPTHVFQMIPILTWGMVTPSTS